MHPRDRRCDERPVIDGLAKPAVLQRATVRAICAIWLALVVYGTLGPLGYAGDTNSQWLSPVDTWHWIPPAQPTSRKDIFTNVLVYIPVGVALALLVRRRRGVWACELALAMSLSVALSYVTELLQQFMPARSANRADLVVNSLAALFGCLIATRAQNATRRCHEAMFWHWRTHPWAVAAWLMTGLTAVLMTVPWDLTWPQIETQWDREFDLLDFRRFAVFVVLGLLMTTAMLERLGWRRQVAVEAVKRLFVFSVLFEAAQIFIESHACGLLDIGTALAGGLVGCGGACWLMGFRLVAGTVPCPTRRALASLALLGLVAFGLIAGVPRINAPGSDSYGPNVLWLPFQVQFFKPFDRVLTGAAESLLLYSSLTILCLYLTQGRGSRVALLLLVGLVGTVQTAQMHFFRGVADMTPLLLAVAAWLIAIRCWNAFVPQPRHAPRAAREPASRAVP